MQTPESRTKTKLLLCQVIPTYNEVQNIPVLVDRIEKLRENLPFDLQIIVVDDNSSDGTSDKVKELKDRFRNIQLIQRPGLMGLGSAYMDGFAYSISNFNADYVGEMDADLQHPPEVLNEMVKRASEGIDVVVASRYIPGGGATDWSFSRRLVSRGANLLTKVFLRVPVKDATSGYRLISQRAIKGLFEYQLSSKGYSFQVESLYAYKKLKMSFAEVPYQFEIRKAGETKLNRKEMWRFFRTTVKTGIFGLKKKKPTGS
ncbi:MAG TPA: polyprenol monophosphomannose synthase [Nitrososphaerales archaeon]|nr:polyprenol monophosphomannose synthase [Nitrososphaerales archaeon]